MRISDWSSDVCSSDLTRPTATPNRIWNPGRGRSVLPSPCLATGIPASMEAIEAAARHGRRPKSEDPHLPIDPEAAAEQSGLHYVSDDMPGIRRRRAGKSFSYRRRSEEQTSELQSLMRNTYAVFCLT